MSTHTRAQTKTVFLAAALLVQGMLTRAYADDPSTAIRLSGIPAPYAFGRVCKLGSGQMWVVGGGGGIQYFSTDGGARKTHVANVDLNGVFFTNANFGWVVGEDGIVARTQDGGLNWKSQKSGVSESLNTIVCTDENVCWIGGKSAVILRTTDGGDNWKKLDSGLSEGFVAASFVDSGTGWLVGENGAIAHTTDGGQSWERQEAKIILLSGSTFEAPTDLLAVKFIDGNLGWVAGAGGVAMTVDGGRSWKTKVIEGEAFIGLVSIDGNKVWAISRHGTNYVTADGGISWSPVAKRKEGSQVTH